MVQNLKIRIYKLLRWSEKWAKTDMVYLAKGGFWLTLGQVISSISGLLLAVAFANLLPKETYGIYKYILSLVSLLSIPTLSGMRTALMQAIARGYEGSIIPAMKTKIRWGLIGGVASVILAGYYFYNGNTTLTISFLITGIFIPFMDSLAVYGPIFSGRKLFKQGTKYNVITQITAAAIMVAVLILTKNIFLILLSYFSSRTLLRAIFLIITFKKFKPNKKEDPETISYGKHLSFISILGTIAGNLDKILLWHFLGATPLAIYAFAKAPVNQLSALLKTIIPLSFPKLAAAEKEDIKKTLPAKMIKFLIVIAIGVLIYIILAPYFYKLIFPQYIGSIKYTQLWVLVLLFFPQKLIGTTLQARAKKKELYILSLSNSILKIILFIILLPLYGIYGAIFANLIPYVWNTVLQIYFLKKM